MRRPTMIFPPSFLRRRLVGFGPDPTIGTAHSFASLAPSCAAGYSASSQPDEWNCAQPRPPRSVLRRRLLGFGFGQAVSV